MKFEYSVMNFLVILFIFGAEFFLQAETCNFGGAYLASARVKNDVEGKMRDFVSSINRIQVNFIQELIDIKFNATFDDFGSAIAQMTEIDAGPLQKARDEGRDISHCLSLLTHNVTFTSSYYSMEYEKCVENQFDTLNPVANNVRVFHHLKELASCPLTIRPLEVLFCRTVVNRDQPECIEVNNRINPETEMPFKCDLNQYYAREADLRNDMMRLASVGVSNAMNCIAELKEKYNASIEYLIRVVTECVNNAV